MPGHGAKVRYSLGTNVNTPFFEYPRWNSVSFPASAQVQGRDLVLRHKSGHPGPCAQTVFDSCGEVQGFVLSAKLMFQNDV